MPNAAQSDLFLVLAKTKNKNYMGETETGLSLFLVDRQEGGVFVSDPAPVTALSGVGFAQVDFKCKGESSAVSCFGFDKIFFNFQSQRETLLESLERED